MNKTISLTIILLVLCHLAAAAQKVVARDTVVDAGRTGYRVPATATFQLENKGTRHLSIKNVLTDCGCTRVDYPHKNIGAGESFTISLTYDARMLGHYTKQAAIYTNGSKKPLMLKMKGVVLRDWQDYSKTYPYRFGQLLTDVNNIEFDDVNKGDRPQLLMNIFNNSEHPMTPNLLHLPSYLQAEVKPKELPGGSGGTIMLTLNTEQVHDYGLTQTNVYMAQQLGEKVSNETEIPVSVVLLPSMDETKNAIGEAPSLYLSTDSITLGNINGKLQKEGTITVANAGKSLLDISSLQLFTRGMTVTLGKRQLKPGEKAKLKIAIDREKLLEAKSKPRVLMITNDPKRSKVVISVGVK